MRIVIDNDFFVDIDERNYTLKENTRNVKKDGTVQESVRTEGYFVDLAWALDRVVHLKLERNEDTLDVKEFMEEYRILAEYVSDKTKTASIEILGKAKSG